MSMKAIEGMISEKASWLVAYLSLSDNALMFADSEFIIRFVNNPLVELFSEVEEELKKLFSFFDVHQLVGHSIDRFHQHPERIRKHLSLLQATWSSDLHLGELLFKLIITPIVVDQVRVGYLVQWKELSDEAILIQQIDAFIQQVKGDAPVIVENVVNHYYLNLLSQEKQPSASLLPKKQFTVKHSLQQLVDHIQSLTQQEVQTERVNTIGFMAAGVAHEINNPIAGVLANLLYLKSVATSEQDVIEESLLALTRVSEIAKGLLNFTRGDGETQHHSCEPILLSSAMMQVLQLLALQLKSKPAFGRVVILPNIPTELAGLSLLINRNDFIHILLNVIGNAVDALSDAAIEQPTVEVSAVLSSDERFMELRITDNGLGVPKPLQQKIFMPFFTTKAQGKGTGMGLALVLNLAKACDAQFFLDTEYQQGARFVLRVALDYNNKYVDIACLNKIKSALGGDFSSVIKTFITQGEREIRYMKSACAEQTFDLLYRDVHRLKGMSVSVCAKMVHQSCVALLALLHQEPDATLIAQEILQLERYFQETIDYLR